ncbi:MAG: glycosyltransferase, partial [Ilumatobacteraceae bacterium]|nr:glycosyltransferase [Ilumatobacteraceae bacterium]
MNPPIWWWILVVVEAATLVVVIPRLWRAARGGRRLHSGEATAVRISVIIPARNEAGRLAQCLAPLRNAPGVCEIIVVDDESSDNTALIARDHGATVVAGKPLPEGWVGKIWALQQGIAAATGDVVVTLDADARPSAELPQAAVGALVESGAALATVAPRFRTTSRSSQWLHAAMLTSLVYRHGAGAGRATKDAVANGQCMVFRRTDAVNNGWCKRVRGSVIEDVALVRMLVAEGKQVEMFDGTALLTVQMFDGFADTWR